MCRDVVALLKSEEAHFYWPLFPGKKLGGPEVLFTSIWSKGDYIPDVCKQVWPRLVLPGLKSLKDGNYVDFLTYRPYITSLERYNQPFKIYQQFKRLTAFLG